MERKIRSELIKMILIMLVMVGVGIYAIDFVIAGIKAKVALNSSIFALFGIAAALAFRSVLSLKNEVLALKALQIDFADRRYRDPNVYERPAIIFHEPQLLGQGYRLITEQLSKADHFLLPSKVAESLVHSVDQRINERKSVVVYFAGLMVFMGLLGAFMGLMHTVGSVGDLIGGMDVSGGGGDSFAKMIEGMKAPLKGMSVGFSSSLFGLSTSMVLGALERCMTSAAKALRDEYEHWISNLTALEGTGEGEGEGLAGVAIIARAIDTAARQIQGLDQAVRDGQRRDADTQNALQGLYDAMGHLSQTVARVTDPAPLVAPIALAVGDLVRTQTRLAAEMELLFAQSREDRGHIREAIAALGETRARQDDMAREEQAAILTRLDRILATGEAALEREPVVIQWPSGDRPANAETIVGGARSLQQRLTRTFASMRERGRVKQEYRRLADDLAATLARQQRLEARMKREFGDLHAHVAADASRAADAVRALEAEREHLAILVGLAQENDETPDAVRDTLARARIQMDVLAERAERMRAAAPTDTPANRKIG